MTDLDKLAKMGPFRVSSDSDIFARGRQGAWCPVVDSVSIVAALNEWVALRAGRDALRKWMRAAEANAGKEPWVFQKKLEAACKLLGIETHKEQP